MRHLTPTSLAAALCAAALGAALCGAGHAAASSPLGAPSGVALDLSGSVVHHLGARRCVRAGALALAGDRRDRVWATSSGLVRVATSDPSGGRRVRRIREMTVPGLHASPLDRLAGASGDGRTLAVVAGAQLSVRGPGGRWSIARPVPGPDPGAAGGPAPGVHCE